MYCCSLIIRLTQVYCKAFWWARDSYVDEKRHPRKQMALCWSYLQQQQTNTGITDAFVIAIACLFVCWQNLFQEILLEKYFVQQNLIPVFQFIIEAVTGGEQGSIAIDDVVVFSGKNGSCPPERECTFQGSLCGLLPHQSANFSWDRITGESQPSLSSGPRVDHTLGTDQGMQMFRITIYGWFSKPHIY